MQEQPLLAEKILSHDSGNATVYIILHGAVHVSRGAQVGSLEKNRRQEKADTKNSSEYF